MTIRHMNAVGVVAVIALGLVALAQGWALQRLLAHLLGSQDRRTPARPPQARTDALMDDLRMRHPSQWPTQGDVDGR